MPHIKIIPNVLFLQKAIIVNPDKKILALKRTAGDHDRSECWDLPGGTYELGEDVIDAIKREITEETSLAVRSLQPIHVASGVGSPNEFMSGENVFAVTYLCRDWSGEVKISDEHTEYKWMTPEEFLTLNFGDDGGFFVASIKQYISSLR